MLKEVFFCSIRHLKTLAIFGSAIFLAGCQNVNREMEPTITCPLQVERFAELPGAFPELSPEELQQEWGKECLLGNAFAEEWDLYRAITCYKRALILLPREDLNRRLQLDYAIILSYYLGNKYSEATACFEASELSQADSEFPAFSNLLVMIYDCYLLTGQEEKADCVMQAIELYSPQTSEDLRLYAAFKRGNPVEVRDLICRHPDEESLASYFSFYDRFAKSPKKAQVLNALLPGAGYYYVEQKRSALTSFIINALFTAAAYRFFQKGYPAAGAITASLEMGWYLGGINGAGIEAREFNTRLFEGVGRRVLLKNRGFPVLMFETSF